jgi:hypothetical protein
MIKLNSIEAQEAWKDYKEFLEGMGMQLEHDGQSKAITRQIEQAYKMGFINGQATVKPEPVEVKEVHEDIKPKKKKRNPKIRTPKEIENDVRLVLNILSRHNGPMQLKDIIKAVNAAGADWYENSASGHMNRVMEKSPAIVKAGYGLYEYKG